MESFGNVVLEALAQGTPVVAVEGTPWRWLEQAGVGRFVPREARAVSHATSQLLEEAERSGPELRARCRAQVLRFSWQEIERRMRELYESCLAHQP
jgi:glycosyltransferase involved in cell wall biosynthesis